MLFALLSLFALCLAISWQWATKALLLLVVWALARCVWSRRWGNPALGRSGRWGMALLLAYFAVNAISMLYTSNLAEGWETLTKHLPFLLLPLVFLLSDMSNLTRNRMRGLLYLFTAALSVRFLVRVGVAIAALCKGTAARTAFFSNFDPMHHAYLAMYTLLALTFVYNELLRHGQELPRWVKVALGCVAGLMMAYTYCIQSRAGLLCLVALGAALLLHLSLQREHRRLGLTLLGSFLVLATAGYFAASNRLSTTLQEVSSGDTSDVRFDIWQNAALTCGQHLPFGVGIGDRMDALAANYPDSTLVPDAQLKLTHIYNPHNQYLDTLLTVGVPGLALLLALLLWPCWCWLRQRGSRPCACYPYLLPLVLIAALSFPFESILERQMGILFFCFFYCLFFMESNAYGYCKSQETTGTALP